MPASPKAVYSAMIAAAGHQRSFRSTSLQTGCGCGVDERISQVTDVAANEGIQRITFTADGSTGHVTVLVIGGTAYVEGDSFALVNYLGYKPDAATAYAGQWIAIPAADPDFDAVADDVTLLTAVEDLAVPNPLHLAPRRVIGGKATLGVTGTKRATGNAAAITESLYGRAKGLPLPVEEDIVQGAYSAKVTLGHWNEHLDLAAPAASTPISATGLE